MGTTLIVPRKRGADPSKLTVPQQIFVAELLADNLFRPTQAAKLAGYKIPGVAANKLLKNKKIQALLGKAMRERMERCELQADDVLHYLKTALFFNPVRYFKPNGDGRWVVEDLSTLPEEICRLIEKIELKVVKHEDGSEESKFVVETVSHTAALALAMKHIGVDRHEVSINLQDQEKWDKLAQGNGEVEVDSVERMVLDAEHEIITEEEKSNENAS